MHECPECMQVCYCDLDDSNDCRDDGECFHDCPPEEDEYGEVLGDLRDGNTRGVAPVVTPAPSPRPQGDPDHERKP